MAEHLESRVEEVKAALAKAAAEKTASKAGRKAKTRKDKKTIRS
jgi:hypothetical protein